MISAIWYATQQQLAVDGGIARKKEDAFVSLAKDSRGTTVRSARKMWLG